MYLSIELFGNLLLTFLGFVLPVVALTLSFYQEGISILKSQYENEKKQAEENIKEQMKRLGEEKDINTNDIRNNLSKLESIKKDAQIKLFFLEPKQQILNLFIPLALSFGLVQLAIIFPLEKVSFKGITFSVMNISLFLSVVFFIYSLGILWRLAITIIEIKKAADENKSKDEREEKQALFSVLEKLTKGAQPFLEKVYITIDKIKIDEREPEVELKVQEKREFKTCILNIEDLMAKNIEIGFIFPTDFIIEGNNYSVYNDGNSQITRYTLDSIHSKTNQIIDSLSITPLKTGKIKVRTFVKAENIKTAYRNLNINIV